MAEEKDAPKDAPKKDEAAAPAKKPGKAPKKVSPFNDAGWNAFGAVILAGFGIAVTAMSSASFSGENQMATIMTLVGGVIIFILSGMFAKMTVTEFGRQLTKLSKAEAAPADAEDDKQAAKPGQPAGRR